MSGTWPTARAAIKNQLNGVTADAGASFKSETLTAFEYAPAGRQPADLWPYCFIIPAEVQVNRYPGQMRELIIDVQVRMMLAPDGEGYDMNALQQRYDAWWVALLDAWDDAATIDGTADISVQQSFSGLAQYADIDNGWGFDMTLGSVRISEVKTFSA
jgi:hypothetical protein